LAFTKPNFIYFNLEKFSTKNILYLDIDVFLFDYPRVIVEISKDNYDFAIYNWLNDDHNECYMPIKTETKIPEWGNAQSRFYIYANCIQFFDNQQLIASGPVSFYRNSNNAKYLLQSWFNITAKSPSHTEDQLLDFAYNNFILGNKDLKPFWLDKSYCRFPFWIYAKPVILHPDFPLERTMLIEIGKMKRVYFERCQPKTNNFIFHPDYIIDTHTNQLIKVSNNQIVDVKSIKQKLWIYPEDIYLT
jgi:hypothetical protein